MGVIFGLILVIFGAWFVLAPKSAFNFDKKEVRLFKAKLVGSKKTPSVYRTVGAILIIIGLIKLFRIL